MMHFHSSQLRIMAKMDGMSESISATQQNKNTANKWIGNNLITATIES